MPRVIFDEILEMEFDTTPFPRVRVRVVELDANCLGVVFSQNRFPERYPDWEVVNQSASITNAIEHFARTAMETWRLIPSDKQVRWFEHYAAPPSANEDEQSHFDEVTFCRTPPPDNRKMDNFRTNLSILYGQPVFTRDSGFENPSWKRLAPDEGSRLVGFEV